MTQNKEVLNLKRIKHLFRIFLKQFEVDEYKLLMQFLQLSINKYNSNQFVIEDSSIKTAVETKQPLFINNNNNKEVNRLKVNKIEQTINMLRNRIANNFEVSLDDEELNLINGAYNQEYIKEDTYNQNGMIDENINSDEPNEMFNECDDDDYNSNINDQYNTVLYNSTPIRTNYNHNNSTTKEETNHELYENKIPTNRETLNNYEQQQNRYASIRPKNDNIDTLGQTITTTLGTGKVIKKEDKVVVGSPRKFIRKFNDEIRHELELKFLENNFISGIEKDRLATRLNLTERQVKKWFEKRREKKRRIEKMSISLGLPPGTIPVKERKQKKRQAKKDPKHENEVESYLQMQMAASSQFTDNLRENPYEKPYLNKRPRSDITNINYVLNQKTEPNEYEDEFQYHSSPEYACDDTFNENDSYNNNYEDYEMNDTSGNNELVV